MGASAQQHRAVTGSFCARLWSSGWTPGSSGRARYNGSWRRRRPPTKVGTSGCLWKVLLFLTNLVVTATPVILGPAMVVTVAGSAVNSLAMTSMQENRSLSVLLAGTRVTSSVVISNTTWLVLLLSGDIETNPGPGPTVVEVGQGYEQKLVEGLAKLCREAPSETVRNVLGVWNPNKPGNEIRNTWQQGKRFLSPTLKGTLAWLTNTRECDVKGTKHDVADQLLIALEALLPDTCQVCKEIYCVEREDHLSLRCKGCSQGFHQACYDRLEVGPSLAELPGEFSWLCTVCAPLYQLKTVVGGSRGQERPRLNRRDPTIPQPTSTHQPAVGGTVGDSEGGADHQAADTEESVVGAHTPPPPPPPPGGLTDQGTIPVPEVSGQDCALFLSGECPHGISGKTGGTCPDKHPKWCMPYMRWGHKSERGCSGTTCGKCHPTLCPKSHDLRCLDRQCPWKLHTHRCLRADTGVRRGGSSGSDWTRARQPRGFRGQRSQGHYSGHPWQGGAGTAQHRQAGAGGAQQWQGGPGAYQHSQSGTGAGQSGGSVPTNANTSQPAAWNNQGFQGMTAQQLLLGTIQQQLQQAVTSAIMQALSGTVPGLGVGMGSAPHSS